MMRTRVRRAWLFATVGIVSSMVSAAWRVDATSVPPLVWARNDGTADIDNAAGVSVDSDGNLCVAGWTNGTFTGFSNAGPSDIFVAQYAASGRRRWLRQTGSPALDIAVRTAIDVGGNCYVVGQTYGSFDRTTVQSRGDAFLMKYSSTGTEVWRRQFGTTAADQVGGLTVDGAGNLLIVGSTEGAFGDATNAGETDVFVAKFSSAGSQLWARQFGTTNFDYGYGIAVDAWGTIAVVGETQGQFPGQRETGITDAFVATLKGDGSLRWLRQEDSGPDFAYNRFTSVVMDDLENVIVAGSTGGSYNADTIVSGTSDAVVIAYNKLATRLWVRQFGTSSTDAITSMSRAVGGDIFVVGNTSGKVYGYTGTSGLLDAFIARLTRAGTITWWQQYGTANVDDLVSVATVSSGEVVAVGYTKGKLTPNLIPRNEDSVMMRWSAFTPVVPPSSVVRVGATVSRRSLVALGHLTMPIGSTISLTVPRAYRTNCAVARSAVKARRAGRCRVVVVVTNESKVARKATVTLTIR